MTHDVAAAVALGYLAIVVGCVPPTLLLLPRSGVHV